MEYPFEKYRSTQKDKTAFLQLLPQVSAAMPEFFRALAVAYQSIEQKTCSTSRKAYAKAMV